MRVIAKNWSLSKMTRDVVGSFTRAGGRVAKVPTVKRGHRLMNPSVVPRTSIGTSEHRRRSLLHAHLERRLCLIILWLRSQ